VSSAITVVRRIVEQGGDVDDMLRTVVEALAAEPGVRWAAIAFNESGALRVGPSAGVEDEEHRSLTAISYEDALVGELRVDGDATADDLLPIADALAPYVLIGWDTSGEAWDP
jgi:hypothetical protein